MKELSMHPCINQIFSIAALCSLVLSITALEIYAGEAVKTGENATTTKRVYHLTRKPDQQEYLSDLIKSMDDQNLSELLTRITLQPIELSDVTKLHESRQALFSHAQQRLADIEAPLSTNEAGLLIMALSLVNDDEALNIITQIGSRFYQETGFTQQLLFTLRDLPVSGQIQAYVDHLLEQGHGRPELIRSALLYYAAVEHPPAMRWAAYYRTPGIDAKIRFAGLYLASVLGKDAAVKQWILDEITRQPPVPAYQQYFLLRAYRHQADDVEFNHVASNFSTEPPVLKQVQREDEFVAAEQEMEPSLAKHLLNSPHYEQQRMALLFWLNEGKLLDSWAQLDSKKRLMAIRLANSHGITLWPDQSQETDTTEEPDYSKDFFLAALVTFLLIIATAIRLSFNRGNAQSIEEKS